MPFCIFEFLWILTTLLLQRVSGFRYNAFCGAVRLFFFISGLALSYSSAFPDLPVHPRCPETILPRCSIVYQRTREGEESFLRCLSHLLHGSTLICWCFPVCKLIYFKCFLMTANYTRVLGQSISGLRSVE
jgi:hypothetical protein